MALVVVVGTGIAAASLGPSKYDSRVGKLGREVQTRLGVSKVGKEPQSHLQASGKALRRPEAQ